MEENVSSTDLPEYSFSFSKERAQQELERIRAQEAEQARKRREGRVRGEITQSLSEKLDNCNILQLKRVIKVCNRLISYQKHPPTEDECHLPYVVRVLTSITIRNKRFQIELRRNSARAKRLYINGPYVRAYWRDGQYLNKRNYGKDKLRLLPRKVQRAFKEISSNPEVEELRMRLQGIMSAENQ